MLLEDKMSVMHINNAPSSGEQQQWQATADEVLTTSVPNPGVPKPPTPGTTWGGVPQFVLDGDGFPRREIDGKWTSDIEIRDKILVHFMLYECTNGNVKASLWSFKPGMVPCCTNNDLVPVAAVPWTAMGVPGLHLTFKFARGDNRAKEEFLVQFRRKSDNAIVCTQCFPVFADSGRYTKKRNNVAQHSATTPSPSPSTTSQKHVGTRPGSALAPEQPPQPPQTLQPPHSLQPPRKACSASAAQHGTLCVMNTRASDEIRASLDNLVILAMNLQIELGAAATGHAFLPDQERLRNTCVQLGQQLRLRLDAQGKALR
eukprot:TRINITY_DN1132_c0_g1_i8.p1 TRINITY_DN1132_c0_g1~~TRINITY_DN1132_c0_g1_i8.p1  ORF type:complete len:316 (+),score=54.36 TRINITY_DN1132_c0_g1_i8:606-1553(+)